MRIEVVDPGGLGLGLAIGLLELGHDVRYRSAEARRPRTEHDRMTGELVDRCFGGALRVPVTSDLLVLVDSFADQLECLERRVHHGPVVEVTHPLQDDAGILVYSHRLQYFLERAQAADRVAVVDMSDLRGPREIAFEQLPNATLFARETPACGDGPWQPLPFLYNQVVLWLEHCRPPSEWWQAADRRRWKWDWLFCGTVDHPRYGERRRVALDSLAERWPGARGAVVVKEPFADVVTMLQQTRCGVDLPGAGELCFRLHECLAVGTPLWRPLAGTGSLPEGLAPVVVGDPKDLPVAWPDEVRAVYLESYAPRAAAATLLAGVEASAALAT